MKLYKPIIFLCASIVLFCGSSRCVPSGASERPPIEPNTNLSDQEPSSYTNLSDQEPSSNAKQPTIIELPKSLKQYLSQLESDAPNCSITCDGETFNVKVDEDPMIETFDQWLQYSIKYAENKDRNISNIICCTLQFAHNNMSDFNKHKYMIWPSVENINFNTDQGTEIYTFPELLSAIRLGEKKEVLLLILKFAHNNTPLFNTHKDLIFSLMHIIFNKSHLLHDMTIKILFSAHGTCERYHTLFGEALSNILRHQCDNEGQDFLNAQRDFLNVINLIIKSTIKTNAPPMISLDSDTFKYEYISPPKTETDDMLKGLPNLHKLMSYFMDPEDARKKLIYRLTSVFAGNIEFITLSPDSPAPQIS